ncbi:MAG TPA: tRNA (adenosine(37)-N6)-threonylcarbamoyltransferase complex dimerization subunit type 1 TsaB [Terriglobales bacterium]
MLILATDTSGKHGSIALARCGAGADCDIIEVVPLEGGMFSAQLVPQISALLAKHQFQKEDISGFAVGSGPGSFTGLRVGLAAIKALAEALAKPIATVSLLEAIAVSSGMKGVLSVALDAGRNEVYLGEYNVGTTPKMLRESLLSRDEFLSSARNSQVISPDKSIAGLARSAGLKTAEVERPRSDVIARLGWRKIQCGETVSPALLDANYIRRSDAEIFAKS